MLLHHLVTDEQLCLVGPGLVVYRSVLVQIFVDLRPFGLVPGLLDKKVTNMKKGIGEFGDL